MRYQELRIVTNRDHSEPLQTALINAGFDTMQIDDSADAREILADPTLYKYDYLNEEIEEYARNASDDITITLYFTDDEEGKMQLAEAKALLDSLKLDMQYESMLTGDDSEWLYKWQEFFKTTRIGDRIVIKPSWESYEPAADDLVIEMDPGMAFGSGLHETTSMCIKALEKYLKPGMKVLDVGTGTGILAMAAVLLGAESSLGIDIDDEAISVAEENIHKNGLEEKIEVRVGDLMEGVDYQANIIVANLMADLVMKMAPAAEAQLDKGDLYISSGILDTKLDTVCAALKNAGFKIGEVLSDGDWRTIVAFK